MRGDRTEKPTPSFHSRGDDGGVRFSVRERAKAGPCWGIGRFAYGPDGKALYAELRNDLTTVDKHEVYRIDLNPIRVSAVPAQVSLKPIHSMAVSIREDRLLISGGYEEGGRST